MGRLAEKPVVVGLICGVWALALSYPLGLHPLDHIPLGTETAGTVPFFNLWTLQWNIDQLAQGYPRYWDAPIFAPTPGAFAFSETQPLSALLAAPLWLGLGSPALAYNALVLLFLALNGWFAYWLLRGWGLPGWPALFAGLLVQSLPFVAQEMGVLQLIALFGLLWSLLFLTRFLARPAKSRASALGLALGTPVTFFTCSYYGLFSLFFLPLALLIHLERRHSRLKTWGRLLAIGLLALILTGPFLWAQRRQLAVHGFARRDETVAANSASWQDYGRALDRNLLYGRLLRLESGPGQRLFPGAGLLLLAGLGLWGRERRRTKIYLIAAALLALALSLGLRLELGPLQPYRWLKSYAPGFAQLRSPFRFAALVQLHLALLAGFGFQNLGAILARVAAGRAGEGAVGGWGARARRLALILVAGLALAEALALPLPLLATPPPSPPAPWQTWLNGQARPPRLILLPFAASSRVADFEQTTRWMLDSRAVRAEMLNGYSGFFPPGHAQLREAMLEFPAGDSLDRLRERAVAYVVVFHRLAGAPDAETVGRRLSPLFRDAENAVTIYGLTR